MTEPTSKKNAGRPKVGVTAKNAGDYYWQVHRWWKSDNMAKSRESAPDKIRDGQWLGAVEAFKAMDWNAADMSPEQIERFGQWCEQWLTEYGWKRLQANVRQIRRARKLKTIQLDYGAWENLAEYAKRHNLTLSNAIQQLLDSAPEPVEQPQEQEGTGTPT